MLLKINPVNPEINKIKKTVEILQQDGIIVYPTDTIYGLGCDIFSKKAISKIYQIKKRDKKKPLSIICADLKMVAEYALVPDQAFKLIKKYLPGPFTFILKAKSKTPTSFLSKNKTIGIRIPDNKISLEIVKALDNPIITTSLNISGEKALTNPAELTAETRNKINLIIDQGTLNNDPSTIIDLSTNTPQIIRQGAGQIQEIS